MNAEQLTIDAKAWPYNPDRPIHIRWDINIVASPTFGDTYCRRTQEDWWLTPRELTAALKDYPGTVPVCTDCTTEMERVRS